MARFSGTQLAGCGAAGMPLLMACLVQGEERHAGLFIREARKTYGSQRRIGGPRDRSRPVAVIDDVLGTGHSMNEAIAALQEGCGLLARYLQNHLLDAKFRKEFTH